MTGDSSEQRNPYSGNSVESLQTAEWATRLPVGNYAFREAGPDSRQPGNLGRTCPVDVNFFAGP